MNNEKDRDIILSQWQTCVEMANQISHRRDTMNNIFVTLNLALVAIISYVWEIKTIFASIIGVVFCVIWILFINNFKQLNKEKFKIINALEKELPVKPFKEEWDNLKNNKKYKNGTTIEYVLPTVFLLSYIIVSVIIFITK